MRRLKGLDDLAHYAATRREGQPLSGTWGVSLQPAGNLSGSPLSEIFKGQLSPVE